MVYMCSLVTQIKREHNTIFALEKEIKANTILLDKKKELDDLDINIKEIDTRIEKEEIKKNEYKEAINKVEKENEKLYNEVGVYGRKMFSINGIWIMKSFD